MKKQIQLYGPRKRFSKFSKKQKLKTAKELDHFFRGKKMPPPNQNFEKKLKNKSKTFRKLQQTTSGIFVIIWNLFTNSEKEENF